MDNVTLYYVENQDYVAVEPTFIDYYVGNEPALPRTPDHLDKDSLLRQERIGALYQLSEKCQATRMRSFRFEFDKVETYALRLRFEGLTSPLALTELQVHDQKSKEKCR